jgi:hypothetical protein
MLTLVHIPGAYISFGLWLPVVSPGHHNKQDTTHVVWWLHTPTVKNVAHTIRTDTA